MGGYTPPSSPRTVVLSGRRRGDIASPASTLSPASAGCGRSATRSMSASAALSRRASASRSRNAAVRYSDGPPSAMTSISARIPRSVRARESRCARRAASRSRRASRSSVPHACAPAQTSQVRVAAVDGVDAVSRLTIGPPRGSIELTSHLVGRRPPTCRVQGGRGFVARGATGAWSDGASDAPAEEAAGRRGGSTRTAGAPMSAGGRSSPSSARMETARQAAHPPIRARRSRVVELLVAVHLDRAHARGRCAGRHASPRQGGAAPTVGARHLTRTVVVPSVNHGAIAMPAGRRVRRVPPRATCRVRRSRAGGGGRRRGQRVRAPGP